MGSFQKNSLLTPAPMPAPHHSLNNLETRICSFAENSILAALEHLLEQNSAGILP